MRSLVWRWSVLLWVVGLTSSGCWDSVPAPCENRRVEVCNGHDDNCDGVTDEGNPGGGEACGWVEADPSSWGTGNCRPGTLECVEGDLRCRGFVGPAAEVCNGLDDDCDGAGDERVFGTLGGPWLFAEGVPHPHSWSGAILGDGRVVLGWSAGRFEAQGGFAVLDREGRALAGLAIPRPDVLDLAVLPTESEAVLAWVTGPSWGPPQTLWSSTVLADGTLESPRLLWTAPSDCRAMELAGAASQGGHVVVALELMWDRPYVSDPVPLLTLLDVLPEAGVAEVVHTEGWLGAVLGSGDGSWRALWFDDRSRSSGGVLYPGPDGRPLAGVSYPSEGVDLDGGVSAWPNLRNIHAGVPRLAVTGDVFVGTYVDAGCMVEDHVVCQVVATQHRQGERVVTEEAVRVAVQSDFGLYVAATENVGWTFVGLHRASDADPPAVGLWHVRGANELAEAREPTAAVPGVSQVLLGLGVAPANGLGEGRVLLFHEYENGDVPGTVDLYAAIAGCL